MMGVHLGIADHLGWAVAVTASADHEVVDRRRMDLVEPGLPAAPVHHRGGPHLLHRSEPPLDDEALVALVAEVRASLVRTISVAFDDLLAGLAQPVLSISLRTWPADFPAEIGVQRRVPYESRADAIMYRRILADLGRARGWRLHTYDAKSVEEEARGILGSRADDVLHGPRTRLGPPWTRDHRMALAATITAVQAGHAGRT